VRDLVEGEVAICRGWQIGQVDHEIAPHRTEPIARVRPVGSPDHTGGGADGNAGDDAKRYVPSTADRLIDHIKQSGDGAPFVGAERAAAL
jgi:hypothetical protein